MAAELPDRVFTRLGLRSWRQFGSIDLALHPRLTVVTGANASGKTTILNVLSQHFGWAAKFVGVPAGRSAAGTLRYLIAYRKWLESVRSSEQIIGQIAYSDGATSDVVVPVQGESALYSASFRMMQQVIGLYLTSHRALAAYQPVGQIPTTLPPREQMLQQHISEYQQRYAGGHSQYTPTYRIKEALISLAVFGVGSEVVQRNEDAYKLYLDFEQVLKQVLPPTLGFERLAVEPPELMLETRTGRFPLDSVSGGTQAIMDSAWQIFLRSLDGGRFVVLMDEPENHLHPELQRSLLPGMLEAFPSAQFIIATHNPFIVTSVPDSHVYALRYTDNAAVEAVLLDSADKAGSSNDVLRDVLGLDSTSPLWVERQLTELVERFESAPSPEGLRTLRDRLIALGMGDAFPAAVDRALGPDQ